VTKILSYLFGLDSFQMHTIVNFIYVILVCIMIMDLINNYFHKRKFKLSSSPKEEPLVTKIFSYLFGLDSFQMHTIVNSIYVILICMMIMDLINKLLPHNKPKFCSTFLAWIPSICIL
jgi:uncharacterized membrane protein